MATAVGIMDRVGWKARTDVLVVADPFRRLLLWVPRDLWIPDISNRVNAAFARGGHELLIAALSSVGIDAAHSVCVARRATERALEDASVIVPVSQSMEFWYPLTPHSRLQDGRKPIRFDPPSETLSGERIHQWLGARKSPTGNSNDLHRLRRQQVFIRALLQQGFDFGSVLADPELVRISSPAAIDELRSVGADWHFDTFDDLRFANIDGVSVLVTPDLADEIAAERDSR